MLLAALVAVRLPAAFAADPSSSFPPSVGDFGEYGLLQMPNARTGQDGDFHFTYSHVRPYDRYTLDNTVFPWLEASFAYTAVTNRLYGLSSFSGSQSYKDREINLKLRLFDEGPVLPDISLGFRNLAGVGLFSGEYLVASRRYYDFDFTAGMSWGYLGHGGSIPNPFGLLSPHFKRQRPGTSTAGQVAFDFFQAPKAGFFGGIEYRTPIQGLRLKLEYDSNNYQSEPLGNVFHDPSPVNFAVDYAVSPFVDLSAGIERGNTFMLRLTFNTNFNTMKPTIVAERPPPAVPQRQLVPPRGEALPPHAVLDIDALAPTASRAFPVAAERGRPYLVPAPLAKPADGMPRSQERRLATKIFADLKEVKLVGEEFAMHGDHAWLRFSNNVYRRPATALGRAARIMMRDLPPDIEALDFEMMRLGVRQTRITLMRRDLDNLFAGTGSPQEVWHDATVATAGPGRPRDIRNESAYPAFSYGLNPKLRQQLGGPNNFFLYQVYAELGADARLTPNFDISGALLANIANNFNELKLTSNSALPHVRSDIKDYIQKGKYGILRLQEDWISNLAPDLYGRVSAGILEEMYDGVDAELLYRPTGKRWAVGLDVSHVYKRGFDELLDLDHYSVSIGNLAFYYRFDDPQIDVTILGGRYLARDWGATVIVGRTFETGITIGAFATKTNVSAAQFGEGAFDKGFFISFPLDLILGGQTLGTTSFTYRPLTRDGGQLLSIAKPLYGVTDANSYEQIGRSWGGLIK